MKYQLTDQLKQHMQSNNLSGISLLTKIRNSWGGSYAEVSAKFSDKPKGSDIDTYDVDGFKIYAQQSLVAEKEVVTLGLDKLLFMEKVTVDGLKSV